MAATHVAPAGAAGKSLKGMRRAGVGECIYNAGQAGTAWRIRRGAVRFDRDSGEHGSFAGLALAGDIIGAETLLFGTYSFDAHALADCELEPWLAQGKAPSGKSLLQMLAAAECRAADALALRAGEALERVRKLIVLLAGDRTRVSIPGLKDMAEMTGLTAETVSRAMSHLRRLGVLKREGQRTCVIYPAGLRMQ